MMAVEMKLMISKKSGSGFILEDSDSPDRGTHPPSCFFCTLSLFTYFVNQARLGKLYCLNRVQAESFAISGEKHVTTRSVKLMRENPRAEIGKKTLQGHEIWLFRNIKTTVLCFEHLFLAVIVINNQ